MAGLNACGLQSKRHFVSEAIIIIILQVWCSLKSVTTTLGLLFSWLHNYTALHCTVVIHSQATPDYAVLLLINIQGCQSGAMALK